jgi:hydroxymethylpyrimidine pyrophosphatase-like HAD family hydrolase
MPQVSLVVTDLDGTFWHTQDRIDDKVVTAAAELTRRGVPLLVATGRRLASTRQPLLSVGLTPPAVVLNGALGVDLANGERFHCSAYSPCDAVAVLDALSSVGLAPVVYVDRPDHEVFVSPSTCTHPGHLRVLGPTARVDELDRVVAEETVLGFGMIGIPHGDAVRAAEAVGPLAETHLDRSLDYPGTATLTIAPRGRSKWDGVLAYCARVGLDPGAVLAVADGPNDLELLDNAAVRLVPEIAHPAALERADHVIPAAASGGWVSVLDHLGPAAG